MKKVKFLFIVPVGILVLMLAGCPQQRTIAQLNSDPGSYFNKEVTVVGNVTHSFGALGQGIYEINDGTGSIWVLSQNYGVPSDGTKVGVTGYFVPTLTFAGKSFANAIRESKHRSHP